MKKILFLSFLWLSFTASAQNNTDNKLLQIDRKIKEIITQKSLEFRQYLDTINQRLKEGKISEHDAQFQKKQLAKHYADDLDYSIYKLTKDLKQISKGRPVIDSIVNQDAGYTVHRIRLYRKHRYDTEVHYKKWIYSYLYFSIGFNNILQNEHLESLEYSPYQLLDSRYFEIGIDWKADFYRHKLMLKYGFSFMWNTLKPTGNRYHIVRNDSIYLVEHPYTLTRSKMRSIWLKIPIGIEINLPRSDRQHFRLAAGVYGKIRSTTKQKLTFDDGSGDRDQVIKNKYTMPNINYGISAEIGGNAWSIYANYDLKPMYINSRWNLLSVGIKLEL